MLYLPTWWKYNCPENPNVLKACLADLHEVPQTSLITQFSANLRYLPETFHQTFREGLPKPSPQRMADQEQEQNIDTGANAPPLSSSTSKKIRNAPPDPAQLRAFDAWYLAYPKHVGRKPALRSWLRLNPDMPLTETIMAATARYVDIKADVEPRFLLDPATWINQERWADELVSNGNGHIEPPKIARVEEETDSYILEDGIRIPRPTYRRKYG